MFKRNANRLTQSNNDAATQLAALASRLAELERQCAGIAPQLGTLGSLSLIHI